MSTRWGLRYLTEWHLKITQPSDFNDPFELKSPSQTIFSSENISKLFDEMAYGMALEEIAKVVQQRIGLPVQPVFAKEIAAAIVTGPTSLNSIEFVARLSALPGFSKQGFEALSSVLSKAWPALLENARDMCQKARPAFNAHLERSFADTIPAMLGVLCLSRNLNQPLMWAHYADCHRGLMIEFDTSHSAFNKRRSEVDEFGFLREVRYTDVRPALNYDAISGDQGFQTFALTKSNHWSYEEEMRLVWPLEQAEKKVEIPNGHISLIPFPPESVVSVTLGCKALEATKTTLVQVLSAQKNCDHIQVRQARLHDTEFAFVYDPIDR
jgi:hypothetical protein